MKLDDVELDLVCLKGFIGCSEGGPIGVRVHIPDDHPIAKPLA